MGGRCASCHDKAVARKGGSHKAEACGAPQFTPPASLDCLKPQRSTRHQTLGTTWPTVQNWSTSPWPRPFRLPQRSPPCQVTSQGLPRLQPAGTKVSRVANRKEFSHDRARSGTIPVRRREERVCGDAAITHRCSCPREPGVLSPHRLQGAAILLARPMNEAGLPVRHVRCSVTVKARLREIVDGRGGVFTCRSGAAGRDWVEATLLGARTARARGQKSESWWG